MNRFDFLTLFAAAPVQTTGAAGFLDDAGNIEIKTYYERQLLKNAEPALIHDQCAEKYTIPKGSGHTIEWRKFSSLPKAMTALTEGVTPDGSTLTVTRVTDDLAQYGDFVRVSDRLELEAIDPIVSETSALQGSQAGITLNTVTRDALAAGTNIYCPNGKAQKSALAKTDTLELEDIFDAAAIMRANNVPTVDGECYVCFIHPYIANDLMKANLANHGSWIDVNKYANAENIMKGEIGKVAGVRFVTSSECKVVAGGSDFVVYHTTLVGKGGYAVTELSGAGLEYIVKQLGYGDDPLNQRASMGWKAMRAATILDQTRVLNILSACATKPQIATN